MDIKIFVQQFSEQFDEVATEDFTPETRFKENEEWGSMTALAIIALADDTYQVRLTGNDIRNAETIRDVYEIIASRLNT